MLAKTKKIFFIIFLSLCISTLFTFGTVQAQTYNMRIQCVYPENSNGSKMLKIYAEKVEKYTNDQINVELYWSGQLVKAKDAYKAVSNGMIEGVYAASIYYGGIVPETKVEWMPFTWPTPEAAHDVYYKKGLNEFLQKAHQKHGVYSAGTWFTGTMAVMANFDIKSLKDLKGKKIRAMGSDAPLVVLLGATPVAMSGVEIYMAMQRKIIDATIYPMYTIETYKFYEVASTILLPGFHSPNPTSLFINDKFRKSLNSSLQSALDRAANEVSLLSVDFSNKWDQDTLNFCEKKSINIVTLSKEELKTLKNEAKQTWNELAVKLPECKEGIDLILNSVK